MQTPRLGLLSTLGLPSLEYLFICNDVKGAINGPSQTQLSQAQPPRKRKNPWSDHLDVITRGAQRLSSPFQRPKHPDYLTLQTPNIPITLTKAPLRLPQFFIISLANFGRRAAMQNSPTVFHSEPSFRIPSKSPLIGLFVALLMVCIRILQGSHKQNAYFP